MGLTEQSHRWVTAWTPIYERSAAYAPKHGHECHLRIKSHQGIDIVKIATFLEIWVYAKNDQTHYCEK